MNTMSENRGIPSEISPEMVCSIANLAAMGVDGIEKTYMSLKNMMVDAISRETIAKGVRVKEDPSGYKIDVYVITAVNVVIPDVCRVAQIKVKDSVEIMTGKPVAAVNMHVEGSGKY